MTPIVSRHQPLCALLALAACRVTVDVDADSEPSNPDTPTPDSADTPEDETSDTPLTAPPAADACARPPTRPPRMPTEATSLFSSSPLGDGSDADCLFVEDFDRDGFVDVGWIPGDAPRLDVRWGSAVGWAVESYPLETQRAFNIGACTLFDDSDDADWDLLVGAGEGLGVLMQTAPRDFAWDDMRLSFPGSFASAAQRPVFLAPADLDGHGSLDIIVGIGGRMQNECVADDTADTDQAVDLGTYIPGPLLCYVADDAGSWTLDSGDVCPFPVLPTDVLIPYGAAFGDLQKDGLFDAVIPTDFGINGYLQGRTGSGLQRPSSPAGFEVYNHGMGALVNDINGDGRQDLFVTDIGVNDLYLGATCDAWFQSNALWRLPELTRDVITWGVAALDVDRNGGQDIVATMSVEVPGGFTSALCDLDSRGLPAAPALALLQHGDGFHRIDVPHAATPGAAGYFAPQRLATGDLNRDGRPDFVVAGRHGVVALYNVTPPEGAWLQVDVVDADGMPSMGASVDVVDAGGFTWNRTLWPGNGNSGPSELSADFGLGDAAPPLTVHVTWADGTTQTTTLPQANQRITVAAPIGALSP